MKNKISDKVRYMVFSHVYDQVGNQVDHWWRVFQVKNQVREIIYLEIKNER